MNPEATEARAKAKSPWWKTLAVVFFALSVGVLPTGLLVHGFIHASGTQLRETDAGFRKITNTLDAEAVRTWALQMNRKKASQEEITKSMPKELLNLYDEPPEVSFDGAGLALNWGGGFFHWVFYIGETNETLPFKSSNPQCPYNFEWRPGIYYTREANLELQ